MPGRLLRRIQPAAFIRSVLGSRALLAAGAMGVGGLTLACGNLLLARALPTEEFARFVLLFAIVMIGINVGPVGADVILARKHFDPSPRLYRQVLLTAGGAGALLALIAGTIYPLNAALLAAVWVSIAASGVITLSVTHYRSRQRFAPALALTLTSNVSVLAAAFITLWTGADTALPAAIIMSVVLSATALLSWHAVSAGRIKGKDATAPYPWTAAWSAASFVGAGILLTSLERLAAPGLLSLSALAILSVLAIVAGSPFAMLSQGVGYTLVPALRQAASQFERRRVFFRESAAVAATCVVAAITTWWLTPLVLKYVLAGRYRVSWPLLLVIICVGFLKVSGALAAAAVNALGSTADLVRLGTVGWLSIALALAGAAVGARWGLPEMIAGIGCAWLVRTIIIGWLATPHLARAAPASAREIELPFNGLRRY